MEKLVELFAAVLKSMVLEILFKYDCYGFSGLFFPKEKYFIDLYQTRSKLDVVI